jgi:hypothetical protein
VRRPRVYTSVEGTWILIVNVRGVETGYLQAEATMQITVSKSALEIIFEYIEPFIAFIIATLIITTAS